MPNYTYTKVCVEFENQDKVNKTLQTKEKGSINDDKQHIRKRICARYRKETLLSRIQYFTVFRF